MLINLRLYDKQLGEEIVFNTSSKSKFFFNEQLLENEWVKKGIVVDSIVSPLNTIHFSEVFGNTPALEAIDWQNKKNTFTVIDFSLRMKYQDNFYFVNCKVSDYTYTTLESKWYQVLSDIYSTYKLEDFSFLEIHKDGQLIGIKLPNNVYHEGKSIIYCNDNPLMVGLVNSVIEFLMYGHYNTHSNLNMSVDLNQSQFHSQPEYILSFVNKCFTEMGLENDKQFIPQVVYFSNYLNEQSESFNSKKTPLLTECSLSYQQMLNALVLECIHLCLMKEIDFCEHFRVIGNQFNFPIKAQTFLYRELTALPHLQVFFIGDFPYLMNNVDSRPDCCFIMTKKGLKPHREIQSFVNACEYKLTEESNLLKMYWSSQIGNE